VEPGPDRDRRCAGARGRAIGIGSGGPYALSAARALIDIEGLSAEAIARKAMGIAADICIYTNRNITLESL
jgi:ATP-dependent HslUV protease subunit HslV